ncbi:4Fe-4S dicluster domain-containing protein [bacterium]|nr:4Fe-4S dicluster domain-containing protein [candidate division CSSED10-310 bacterium]
MGYRIDPSITEEIARYGGDTYTKCFNCGNCSAVCPLSEDDFAFPRRYIRYVQLGLDDKLIESPDPWLCYHCGECSDTCPREADPGELMAAARRYAISKFDITGISKLMNRSVWTMLAVFIALSAVFTALLLSSTGLDAGGESIFGLVPGKWIHDIGVVLIVVISASMVVGVVRFYLHMRNQAIQKSSGRVSQLSLAGIFYAIRESLWHTRYRKCEDEGAFFTQRWFAHMGIIWGFLGLLFATTYDFLFKPIGQEASLLHPGRLVGTISGLLLLYGTITMLYLRHGKKTYGHRKSHFTDYFFIYLILFVGLTGFLAEIALYVAGTPNADGIVLVQGLFWRVILIIHIVLSIDLIVLLPLTKFAHAIYRPMALWMHGSVMRERERAADGVPVKARG